MLFSTEQIDSFERFIAETNAAWISDLPFSDTVELMLSNCGEEYRNKYFALLEQEKHRHSAEVQHQLAHHLLEMGNALRQKQFPNTPTCQWLQETYRAPALFWVIKAVDQLYIPAYYTESRIVSGNAKDISENLELARALTYVSAHLGYTPSQHALAVAYSSSSIFGFHRLVEYDMEKANYWYNKIIPANDPKWLYELASHHQNHTKNYHEAVYYYMEVLRQGGAKEYRHLYPALARCLAMIGEWDLCKQCIYCVLQRGLPEDCLALFDELFPNIWHSLNDICLELALLGKAKGSSDQIPSHRAERILKRYYKLDRSGEIVRVK